MANPTDILEQEGEKIPGVKILEMRCLLDEAEKGTLQMREGDYDFLQKMAILTEEVFELTRELYIDITPAQASWIDDMYERYHEYLTDN